jgi:hypothetical protein
MNNRDEPRDALGATRSSARSNARHCGYVGAFACWVGQLSCSPDQVRFSICATRRCPDVVA